MDTLHRWLLGKLAELLGSREAVTHRLEAPLAEVDRWLRGDEPMPQPTFLKAVDLLLELSRQPPDEEPGAGVSADAPADAPPESIKPPAKPDPGLS